MLFLTLNTFSLTGGIEKVCRSVSKVLTDLSARNVVSRHSVLSMYDDETDERYVTKANFTGFSRKKISFALRAISEGYQADIVILSHVHLLLFAWIIKKLKPKVRIVLFAHGIEIWNTLATWKRVFLQNSTEIWAVSHYTASKIKQIHHVDSQKITILHNCIDPYFELPTSFEKNEALMNTYQLNTSSKIIFALCRLSSAEQYKGYDKIIEAMSNLPKSVHFILAGKSDQEEEARLQSLISKYNLQNRITLTGYLSDEQLTDHYLLADVFAMPSKGEGFGITFIEAAACGCAVVAGNEDGSSDALLNGALGTLVNPNDIDSIAQAIEEIFNQPKSIERKNQQQKNCISAFGFDQYAKHLEKLLLV